jgi:hypothetical protein
VIFYVYARERGTKRFYPMARNGLARNRVHAMRWDSEERAQAFVADIAPDNPEWEFEVRQ